MAREDVQKLVEAETHFLVESPLVIIYPQGGKMTTRTHPRPKDRYEHYGLIICDLVRHVARCFRVDEDDVWDWVEKERRNPTTEITNPS